MYELILLIVIFLFILFLLYDLTKNISYDTFSPYNGENNYAYYPFMNTPFWNPLRSTRGMSYDLRGDVPIPYFMNLPFNMSERIPIQNKTLNDIS